MTSAPVTDDPRIARAEAEVDEARHRLLATMDELIRQFEPRRLAHELWEGAKNKSADLAEEAVDAVKARPVAAGGAVAALALFLARGPLIELAGKVTGLDKESRAKRRDKKQRQKAAKTSKDKMEND